MPIIPYSLTFDQPTMQHMMQHNDLVQDYRALFALLDWSVIPDKPLLSCAPGRRPHPRSAYLKALLVVELGFQLHLDITQPYGFNVARTVPSARWLRQQQRELPHHWLEALLAATVEALHEEIPALGETVAFDVTHIYGWVRENHLRVYTPRPFNVSHIPAGDPDCRLGVKKSSNQEQPDGSTKEKKESLFGYGSGVASSTDPVYGDVVLAEFTQPFNENDISYFVPWDLQTVANLNRFPKHITADAAFDAWYVYQAIYTQRTSTERINSQSEALGLKRPKVRHGRSVANLNTLTYILINANALQRARAINALLLPLPWRTAA
jgi:hypothetical protein